MRFRDRDEAARILAEGLLKYRGHHPLVLGIPPGGVPMSAIVADRLGCAFDVVLVRKLRTRGPPEVAMAAVDEDGHVYAIGTGPAAGAGEMALETEELRRRRRLYSNSGAAIPPAGHTAIIVDDGMATGTSMVAAIRSIRARRPLRIVVATPVAARPALDLARSFADDLVCLHSPRAFLAIGDFYHDFSPVAESAVVQLLRGRRSLPTSPADTRSALPQTQGRRPTR